MTPYYDEDGITIYHGDCREVLADIPPPSVGLLLTDPPYGVAERTDRKAKGRGHLAECNDFPPVHGDDAPFDPTHLLKFPRIILFGANYYADRLPPSSHWIVWDKLDGLSTDKRAIGFDDNADVELAWTNLRGPARLVAARWKGMLKDTERDERRVHPTQKPVSLMERLMLAYAPAGCLVLDPYMGSGSTLVAANKNGHPAIGIELEERYCEIAARRLAQGSLFGASA